MLRGVRPGVVALIVVGCLVASGSPALAAKKLTASKTRGLDRGGETVRVTGSGYDTSKGIYVAFCVDNGAGALPSPCGGGADMTGASGSSVWISNNPPSYGEGLTRKYGRGGSFTASVLVTRMIGEVDCTTRACAIVTRADHTRTSDRSQDVRIPVRFAPDKTETQPQAGRTPAAAPAATSGSQQSVPKGQKTPVGPPTGRLATATPPSAPVAAAGTQAGAAAGTGTGAAAGAGAAAQQATAADLALTRTSAATPLGHWWAVAAAFLCGVVATALIGRLRRSRSTRTARQGEV